MKYYCLEEESAGIAACPLMLPASMFEPQNSIFFVQKICLCTDLFTMRSTSDPRFHCINKNIQIMGGTESVNVLYKTCTPFEYVSK